MDAKEFGSGKTFGWDAYERDEGKEMLRQLRQILEKEQIRFVLAGGLTPDNISRGDRYFFTGYRGCQFRCGKKNPDREPEKTGKKYRNLCGTCILLFRRRKIRNITVFRYRK